MLPNRTGKSTNISLILADRILALLEDAGATEIQKLCALNAAIAIVPVEGNSLSASVAEGVPGLDPGDA